VHGQRFRQDSALDGGTLPIYEPNLGDIILRNSKAQRLAFTANIGDAVRFGEAIFVCVGTPLMQDGDADDMMIVTEWPQAGDLDWRAIEKSMARPVILDGRNLLNCEQMRAPGFEYQGTGNPFEEIQLRVAASS